MMHCTRAYSIFYFSFHSECLFQRRRRDPTSRQRKVYCILCLLSYCFFCSKFQQLEACTYISNAPTPFFTSRRPRVCCIFFCSFNVYFNAADAILHRDSVRVLLFVSFSVLLACQKIKCADAMLTSRQRTA